MYNNCIKFIYVYIILFVFLYFIRFFNYHINNGKVFIKDLENVIYINNNITHESVYDNLKTINYYIKLKKSSNINLYINSSSGNFDAGYLLISEMERLKKVKILNLHVMHIMLCIFHLVFYNIVMKDI